ncbi:copper resistance protein CopC [Methylomonas sp. AM2-LC]|uniref:copper resistance CopC family protein n=1 Tax=Methylomonas sp. AM2-LC TaxID=3153301 RepID=UPI0032675EEC
MAKADKCLARSKLYLYLLTVLWLPLPALAKAYLVNSQPNENASISEVPAQIDLWFNEEIKKEYLAVAITDDQGKRLNDSEISLDSADHTHIYTRLPKLELGLYLVRYRVMSVDRLLVTGSFNFTVTDAPPPEPTTTSPPPQPKIKSK